jgi:hypothetical protein
MSKAVRFDDYGGTNLSSNPDNGRLGPAALSAVPTMVCETKGGETVLTGLVEGRSALFASSAKSKRSASNCSNCARSGRDANRLNYAMTAH